MLALVFAILVMLVNAITWPVPNVRGLGVVLAVGCVVSNLVATGDQSTRAGVYSMIEILVMAVAFISYTFAPTFTGRNLLRVIAAVSLLSVCVNVAYLGVLPASKAQQHLYDIATNVTFAIECILAGATGVCIGLGNGRFSRSVGRWRGGARAHDIARQGRDQ